MCLESTRLFPRRAKEDIEVGKKLAFCNGELITWYRDYPVTNVVMKTRPNLFTIIKIYLRDRTIGNRFIIEGGFIHSYNLNKVTSKYKSLFEKSALDGDTMYVKAVIPKGALYYKDYWGHSYASNKLILKPSKELLKYFKNK